MWSISGSECVKRTVFCILEDYSRTDVDALKNNSWSNSNKDMTKFSYKIDCNIKLQTHSIFFYWR